MNTIENTMMQEIVKQVMTPEKLMDLANKLGPKIEKALEDKLVSSIKDMIDDNYTMQDILQDIMYEALNDNKVRAYFKETLVRGLTNS